MRAIRLLPVSGLLVAAKQEWVADWRESMKRMICLKETLAAQIIQKSRRTFGNNLGVGYFPTEVANALLPKAHLLQRHHEKGGQAPHVMHARIFKPMK